jgi:alpha-L-fucosidase
VEYRPGYDAKIYTSNTPIGLVISAVNGHRLYTNNQWPNPVVLKIENVKYKPQVNAEGRKSSIDGAK